MERAITVTLRKKQRLLLQVAAHRMGISLVTATRVAILDWLERQEKDLSHFVKEAEDDPAL